MVVSCPGCQKQDVIVLFTTTTVVVFECRSCQHRWAMDVPDRQRWPIVSVAGRSYYARVAEEAVEIVAIG
jgi:hypothetical protein